MRRPIMMDGDNARVALAKGRGIALVDIADVPLVEGGSWSLDSVGYPQARIMGAVVRMHRLVLGLVPGDSIEVDHVNGNRLDNRRTNLRLVTRRGNCMNRLLDSRNTSGFKGATWDARSGRWIARIKVDRRSHWLGSYASAAEAGRAYDAAAIRLHGEFAKTNVDLGLLPVIT